MFSQFLLMGGAGYLWRTGLNLLGSAKYSGFTSYPLQQGKQRPHVVTEEREDGTLYLNTTQLISDQLCLCSVAVLFLMSPDVPTAVLSVYRRSSYGSRRYRERGEQETLTRTGPMRRWQGSVTMYHSLRVSTPVLPSPRHQAEPGLLFTTKLVLSRV